MRRALLISAFLVQGLAAQTGRRGLFVTPAPPPPPLRPMSPGWWGGRGLILPVPVPDISLVPRPVPPAATMAPLWLHNPDYRPERHLPALRDYPAGSLREPAAPAPDIRWQEGAGLLVETDGASTPLRAWRHENNSLVFVTARGARGRVSLDRVDADRSRLPLQ